MNPKFAKGVIKGATNKQAGANHIDTFSDALKELAKCNGCGCNEQLGFLTLNDVRTGDLTLVYVDNGSLAVANLVNGTFTEWVTWLEAMCRWREGGMVGDAPSAPAG